MNMNPKLRKSIFTVIWTTTGFALSFFLLLFTAGVFIGMRITGGSESSLPETYARWVAIYAPFLASAISLIVLFLCLLGKLPGTRR